jgi:hypothetical protein
MVLASAAVPRAGAAVAMEAMQDRKAMAVKTLRMA